MSATVAKSGTWRRQEEGRRRYERRGEETREEKTSGGAKREKGQKGRTEQKRDEGRIFTPQEVIIGWKRREDRRIDV